MHLHLHYVSIIRSICSIRPVFIDGGGTISGVLQCVFGDILCFSVSQKWRALHIVRFYCVFH